MNPTQRSLQWRGPCHAYVGSGETIHHRDGSIGIESRRPCRRKASGFGRANTPACWQHQRDLKRWQSPLTPGLHERSATR